MRLPLTVLVAIAGSLGLMAAANWSMPPAACPGANLQVAQAADDAALIADLVKEGKPLFSMVCKDCHGAAGEGGDGPPLAGNEALSSRSAVVTQILVGDADHGMPAFDFLSDQEIAAVATYVRNTWDNAFGIVTAERVARSRPE